ncbi:hypothetical protein K7640_12580 [Micromonospora sp. PLK6-60]|uniref:hypothetical protein n=1 Tax=Micromonospora sp. PLK6-60 TaxID=2873383 RepID=UPI001CA6A03C|nr:hypothetical protein [Micromonospora sp. PLK6-60]MBY8872672.1 hypothetical protein [Micromonospora sp. PLK6-60]
MRRTLNALGDRLLGMVVPTVSAKAEPCGPLVSKFCYCRNGIRYAKNCCYYSGSCYPCYAVSENC